MTHPDPTLDELLEAFGEAFMAVKRDEYLHRNGFTAGMMEPIRIGAKDAARDAVQSHLRTAVEQEREKYDDLLRECRDGVAQAAYHEDGFDPTDAAPIIERISDVLGDGEDYQASLKCSDDPCERCGEGGIRHTRRLEYAKYEGLCDRCSERAERLAIRARGAQE
jgi:hypothetical protein